MVSQCGTACLIRNSRLSNDIHIQNDVVVTVPPANDSPLSDSLGRIAPSRPTGTFKFITLAQYMMLIFENILKADDEIVDTKVKPKQAKRLAEDIEKVLQGAGIPMTSSRIS